MDPVTGVRFSLGAPIFAIIIKYGKNNALVLVIVLVVGILVGYIFGNKNVDMSEMHQMPDGTMMHNNHSSTSMEDMMHDMSASLLVKTGPDFDKEFLRQMIVHHEGAVDMAEMVLEKSNEPKLKSFAQEIIDLQSKEIKMMQDWLNFGFSINSSTNTDQIFCTMEAKLCSDGKTYVGRQGSNCEFAKCPGEN